MDVVVAGDVFVVVDPAVVVAAFVHKVVDVVADDDVDFVASDGGWLEEEWEMLLLGWLETDFSES